MIQGTVSVVRRWGTSGREVMKALFDAVNAQKYGEVSVNPASLGAGAAAETAVALPAGTTAAGDMVFMQPPFDLEVGLVYLGARISAADTLQIRLYNPTAGTIDGAAKTWTYFVDVSLKLVVE